MSRAEVGRYGFWWGPMDVTRAASLERAGGTARVLEITTDHHRLEVYVSHTGRSIRVKVDGVIVARTKPSILPNPYSAKMHLAGDARPVCGMSSYHFTDDRGKVTCGLCRRSHRWHQGGR